MYVNSSARHYHNQSVVIWLLQVKRFHSQKRAGCLSSYKWRLLMVWKDCFLHNKTGIACHTILMSKMMLIPICLLCEQQGHAWQYNQILSAKQSHSTSYSGWANMCCNHTLGSSTPIHPKNLISVSCVLYSLHTQDMERYFLAVWPNFQNYFLPTTFRIRIKIKRPQFIFQIYLFPFWAWPILAP